MFPSVSSFSPFPGPIRKKENGIQALISATDLELYHMLLEMGFWVQEKQHFTGVCLTGLVLSWRANEQRMAIFPAKWRNKVGVEHQPVDLTEKSIL